MRRLLPDTLAGRTIVILVVGLGLFHLWSIWVYRIGTENLLGRSQDQDLAERLVQATRALATLPADERPATAQALSTAAVAIHWGRAPLVAALPDDGEAVAALRRRLAAIDPDIGGATLRFGHADAASAGRHRLVAAIRLADDSWVSVGSDSFDHPPPAAGEHDVLGSLTAMALGILVVSVFLVRTLTRPLRALAGAADRIGTDIAAPGAPETGPREIRHVARAFNAMQRRVRRLLDDRTQTLAAVSHDLKTPITRLRLRAEFIGDAELRRTIDADLDEMERMLDQTLAFLRAETDSDESRVIDLASLLRTLCDHAGDAGHAVTLTGCGYARLACRPLALKRAFSNLIDNAVKYGGGARVILEDGAERVRVTIDDDGPGIPEDERERVFDPFYRIEGSRSRETGGSGLGLTVARTLVRAHGGDIDLDRSAEGGLRVTVRLPKPAG